MTGGHDRSRDRWVVLRPHDTVQVRDGRSFDAGAGGVAHSVRPWPSTVAGALAAGMGEPESVRGPVLAHCDGEQWEPYLPVPADLVVDREHDVWRMCLPEGPEDASAVCDLDRAGAPDLRPPAVPEDAEEPEPLTGLVPGAVLQDYLHGDLIAPGRAASLSALDRTADPVAAEPRIGVGLDLEARTVKGGLLYRTTHLRLDEDWAFAAELTPVGDQERRLEEGLGPLRFGGLSRMADVAPAPGLAWPEAPTSYPGGRVLVYTATPAVWERGWLPPLPEDAVLETAVVGDPLPMATASPGRDHATFKRRRALYWAVPPGSVYLLKFPNTDDAAAWAAAQHGRALSPAAYARRETGERSRLDTAGFGVVLTGVWS
ncbi:type III-B CRISPR module-associated Cmr3 family protein [Nocardiopsis potens]|uniref:type III-B CRISPR module-associated Cmr3 family protein n=1 Tax=Nocardiopsis potens TaxID=1246458 RepID=UPI00034C41A8|nr:type III-B CRISPR module-associated Cmr3 family protein [Nocardiopsis potens]